jgi:hypothetical protein
MMLKKLHKTIDKIVKARQIQKAKVDSNEMKEELTQEELKKFHKSMVDQLTSIVDISNTKKKSLLPIEDSLSSPMPIESPSTTLISIERISKGSSKTAKEYSKESYKKILTESRNFFKKNFYLDEGIDEKIAKKYTDLVCQVRL